MRLTAGAHLPPSILTPHYDCDAQAAGIVHFGIGAFHRAHQAVYTDDALNAGDRDWGMIGVSLRSAEVATQMNPQNGRYTVNAKSSGTTEVRLVGAVQRVLVARETPQAVVEAIAAPNTKIISFTITEKGYCRAGDGTLDQSLADANSVYAYLAAGLAARREAGLDGLTLLSCDNLADNGAQLKSLLGSHLRQHQPALAQWVNDTCTFPSTMVDRIVPATTPQDRARVTAALAGLIDEATVVTEPFSQWVIEDNFAGPRPRWEVGGAQFTSDVRAFETAKLRMLNGAHSALAYLGLARGHHYVHEAIADLALRPTIEQLMRNEALTSLAPAPGQNLDAYADALLARFANSALNHKLIQIAMDGSQKIPQRWLATLTHHQRSGRQCPALLTALAAWIAHVRGVSDPVSDPLADELAALWQSAGREGIVEALFGPGGLFAQYWVADAAATAALKAAIHPL